MLNHMRLYPTLCQEVSSAEAAPAITDTGGEGTGEASFFAQIKGADDHPANLQKKAVADPAIAADKKPKEPVAPKKADKLDTVAEEPEPEAADKGDDEEQPPEGLKEGEEGAKQQTRWKQLRAEEKRAKELDKTVATLKKEMEDLRKNPVTKEVQAELERHRQREAIYEVERTKEYKENVTAPLAATEQKIDAICAEFKLDPDKLFAAMRETEDWRRVLAIDKIVDESDDVPGGIKSALHKAADSLHTAWLKGSQMKSSAAQLRAAKEAEVEQSTTKQTYEQQQAWQKAVASSKAVMEQKIAPIIKAMPEAERIEFLEALDNAAISDDPEERAMQAHGLEVAAVVTKSLIAKNKEIAELKRTVASLTNARPGTKETTGGDNEDPNVAKDDDDFFARVRKADDLHRR